MKALSGVYFRREDYASFWRRLFIGLFDGFLVLFACWIVTFVLFVVSPPTKATFSLMQLSWMLIAFAYLVMLKRSSFGTLGMHLGKIRIVTHDGQRPTVLAMTYRFGLLGPVNWFFDLGWLSGDPHRQSLRDKMAKTYVIRANAEPLGTGLIVYSRYEIMGWNYLFQEVTPGDR